MSQAPSVSAEPSGRLPGLSVFLPCHNEEPNLVRVVDNFRGQLGRFASTYEIIVVDDGSRDRTGEIADGLAAADRRLRVVHHPVNRGYGGAVISGLKAATLPYVLLCDGDGQFDAAELAALVPMVANCDVVVGRRVRRADRLVRRLNGQAWTALVRLLFGIKITDVDCGFKLFKREFIQDLNLTARGAMISTELMVKIGARGARICEVEVGHLPRLAGEQSGADPKVILRAFAELFRLYGELRKERSG
ncbi:MAG TPA: glycosyltransferase family 2 protein [Candidatus Binataceae bacterium]|jgi:glycosyltransferase involved in cell wall biosynthesis|nr:glycosyltransferase family 2 protein [Candidatus Binataceae bacterium]